MVLQGNRDKNIHFYSQTAVKSMLADGRLRQEWAVWGRGGSEGTSLEVVFRGQLGREGNAKGG